jgi:hypothetical protein
MKAKLPLSLGLPSSCTLPFLGQGQRLLQRLLSQNGPVTVRSIEDPIKSR